MNKLFSMLVVSALVTVGGCGTYRNDAHGTGSTGVRMSGDVDVLGVGVDGAIQAGVHGTSGGYGGRQGVNLGGGYAQQRQPMYGGGGGMQGIGGIPVGECNPAGVGIINGFVDVAVPVGERTRQSKDAGGSMVSGAVRCHLVINVGSGEQQQYYDRY